MKPYTDDVRFQAMIEHQHREMASLICMALGSPWDVRGYSSNYATAKAQEHLFAEVVMRRIMEANSGH